MRRVGYLTTLLAGAVLAGALPVRGQSCDPDEYPKILYAPDWVPAYITNARRGDVLLTSYGGDENPVHKLIEALGQYYNHVLFVSERRDASGATTVSHETSISPGEAVLKTANVSGAPRYWFPEVLRRMVPGNVVADPIDRLLTGRYPDCLNEHGPDDCIAMDARPLNLLHGQSYILRPHDQAMALAAMDFVESQTAEHSIGYSFAAYSNWGDAWDATGDEAPYGRGTGCSGLIAGAVREAGLRLDIREYTQAEREAAAGALNGAIYPQLYGVLEEKAPWFVSDSTVRGWAHALTDQIVNCFAFGGACDDTSDRWSSSALGAGPSISPDDLAPRDRLPTGEQDDWGRMIVPDYAGAFGHVKVAALQCCRIVDGQEVCRDVPEQVLPFPWGHGAVMQEGTFSRTRETLCWTPDVAAAKGAPEPARCLELDGLRDADFDPTLRDALPAIAPAVNEPSSLPTVTEMELIASVEVSPPTTCVGHDVRIAIEPTAGNEHAWIMIGGVVGNPVVLRAGEAGTWDVPVVARDAQRHVDARVVAVDVVDCPGAPFIRVSHHFSPWQTDGVTFAVDAVEGLGDGVTYHWTFGDGETADTVLPRVTHSYALRPQAGPQTTFVATVRATDASTASVEARHGVTLNNPHWLAQDPVRVTLPVAFERMPDVVDGFATTELRVRNITDESVVFDTLTATGTACAPQPRPLHWAAGAPASLVSVPGDGWKVPVAPGEVVTRTLTISTDAFAGDACTVDLLVQGVAGSGRIVEIPAILELGVEEGVGRPLTNVNDAVRLFQSAIVLGRGTVTFADVERLEEEDRLVDASIGAGPVPDGATAGDPPLRLDKVADGRVTLEWGAACAAADYAIYEGAIGDFTSHAPRQCSTEGATTVTLDLSPLDCYYLVVGHDGSREGSYGQDVSGAERPPSPAACLAQAGGSCAVSGAQQVRALRDVTDQDVEVAARSR